MVWEKLIKMVKMLIYCAWPSISVHHEGVITLDMNSSCRILQWEWIAEYLHCWVAFSFTFYHWRPVSSHPENGRQSAGVLLMGCSLWIGIMLLSTYSGCLWPSSALFSCPHHFAQFLAVLANVYNSTSQLQQDEESGGAAAGMVKRNTTPFWWLQYFTD